MNTIVAVRLNWGLVYLVIIALMLSVFISDASARKQRTKKVDNSFPAGCRQVAHDFKLNVLTLYPPAAGQRHSMYFLHNTNSKTIKLHQQLPDDENNVPMNESINANKWAVLSSDVKELKFICTEKVWRKPHGKIINCGDTLRVCEYTNVKYGLNNQGNYWAVSNISKRGAMRAVNRQGILLRQ